MKNQIISLLLVPVIMSLFSASNSMAQKEVNKNYGDIALKESTIPVRSGIRGERPFWNKYSERFIYAPVFDFKTLGNSLIIKTKLSLFLLFSDSCVLAFNFGKISRMNFYYELN